MTFADVTELSFSYDEYASGIETARRRGPWRTLTARLAGSGGALKTLAPYAAIELLLPGGSLMALGLWLIQQRLKKKASSTANSPVGAKKLLAAV